MNDFYGSHFKFGGISSTMYDLIVANIETTKSTQLYGDRSTITIFNKRSNRKYFIDDDYRDSGVVLDIEFITDPVRPLFTSEQKEIEKWLFNFKGYRKFYFDDIVEIENGYRKKFYLNCKLNNPSKIETIEGVVGYRATLEADSDMFFEDEKTISFSPTSPSPSNTSNFQIQVESDSPEYIYPEVIINTGNSGGRVRIINNSDSASRLTELTGLPPNTTIILKGEINYITPSFFYNFAGWRFPRLLDGQNRIGVMGDVKQIRFKFSNRRFL